MLFACLFLEFLLFFVSKRRLFRKSTREYAAKITKIDGNLTECLKSYSQQFNFLPNETTNGLYLKEMTEDGPVFLFVTNQLGLSKLLLYEILFIIRIGDISTSWFCPSSGGTLDTHYMGHPVFAVGSAPI